MENIVSLKQTNNIILLRTNQMQIGKDKADNHRLLLLAEPNDWWVHAADYCSAHGWIKSDRFPRKQIKQMCRIIKEKSSRLKTMKRVKFDISKRKHLRFTNVEGEVEVRKILRVIYI